MMGTGNWSAPCGADRSVITSADTQNVAGVRYIWDDTETWTDANVVWKD